MYLEKQATQPVEKVLDKGCHGAAQVIRLAVSVSVELSFEELTELKWEVR